MQRSTKSEVTTRDKIIHELRELTVITAYLFVCFAAVLELNPPFSTPTKPFSRHSVWLPSSVICAKFMLLGSAVDVGRRTTKPPLILPTLRRSLAFLVLLIVLNIFEEAVVGLFMAGQFRLRLLISPADMVSDDSDEFCNAAYTNSLFCFSRVGRYNRRGNTGPIVLRST